MKKKIFTLFVLLLLSFSSCTSDSNETNVITHKLVLKLSNLPSGYNYQDINIAIYKSKEDYVNEASAIYSGKFNTSNVIEITDGIESGIQYYIDVYSDDNVLANWGSNKPLGSEEYELIQTEYSSTKPIDIHLYENRKLIGEWTFLKYSSHDHHNPHDLTNRSKLVISKGLTVTSFEEYKGVSYKLRYEITYLNTNSCETKFISAEPSLDDYPFADNLTFSPDITHLIIFLPGSDRRTIEFRDHGQEIINYTK